jgi:hypothetical protein
MTAPPTASPIAQAVAELQTDQAKTERQRVTYVEGTVTAVSPANGTFSALVAGQFGGAATVLSGIYAGGQVLPDVGATAQLTLTGAQVTYTPTNLSPDAVGYRELDATVGGDITTASSTASAAQRAASDAATAATAAQTAATQAQTTANGKNEVTWSTAAPTSQTPGVTAGDLWYQRSATTGVASGMWEWSGTLWQSRQLSDSVLSSLTANKIVTGNLSATVTITGVLMTAAPPASRIVLDAAGQRFYDASNVVSIDFNTTTGTAIFRGIVEGALFRTSASGQRLEITGGGTAGGRTLTFYPAGSGQPAVFRSRDDVGGNAGISFDAGGVNRGYLNFASTFADLGYWEGNPGSAVSWMRANPTGSGYGIEFSTAMRVSMTTPEVRWFDGPYTYASLRNGDGLSRVTKFSTQNNTNLGGAGSDTSFVFGVNPGGIDADVYALRFISSNPGATGGFVYFSDKRLKKNVKDYTSAVMDRVMATPIREFTWTETGATGYGFVAQEVPAEAQVRLSPDNPVEGVANPIGVSSEQLVVILWKAAQEQWAAIQDLQKAVATLAAR